MEFEKYVFPDNNGARIIHCSQCPMCDDNEKSSLDKNTAKATGG